MTERTVPGGKGIHADAYATDLDSTADGTSEVDVTYRHRPPLGEYGLTAQRGLDVELEHPVEDVDELYHEAHLSIQFGDKHQSTPTRSTDDAATAATESVAEFDTAILAAADRALEAEGVALNQQSIPESLDELPGPPDRILALLIHDARAMSSYPQLAEHLTETPPTAHQLQMTSVPDQSTFWRTHQRLVNAGYREAVQHAATRAVHATVRNGVPVPEAAKAAHGIAFSPDIDEREVAAGTRRAALRNWVDLLLEELLDPISFGRAANMRHAVEAIFAAIAQGTYAHGLNSARRTAGWHYDMDEIPTAGQVSRLLREVPTEEILRMFTEINKRFIRIASEHGFFQQDYNFALDTTWVTYDGTLTDEKEELKLIENPKVGGDAWLFAAICVTDVDARFALGIDLVEDKSETTEQFRYLLRTAALEGGVNRVHIDREFYSGDAVRMCRAIAEENWVIRAKDQGIVSELFAETLEGESNSARSIEFSDVTPNPNLFIYPVPEEHRDEGNTHMAYLSDRNPADTDIGDLANKFSTRWSVETLFRQLKHDVGLNTTSPDPRMRLFLLQIATLIYNIHTLLNRATSPKYALRLDVAYYEVLLAIVDVVFTKSDATDIDP